MVERARIASVTVATVALRGAVVRWVRGGWVVEIVKDGTRFLESNDDRTNEVVLKGVGVGFAAGLLPLCHGGAPP